MHAVSDTCGVLPTPWGPVGVEVGALGLRHVRFDAAPGPALTGVWAEALAGYAAGMPIPADLPVDLSGLTPFTREVLLACRQVPFGQAVTYAELAARLGRPGAARAVGRALGSNPVPLVVPCHRVLGARGALTGFLGGLDRKAALLRHEQG
jgi:methylated-DNA-[protein]-cysteine S-methyltransferase